MKIPRGQTTERQAYMKQYCATHPKRDRRAYKKAYDESHRAESIAYRISRGDELKAQKRAYYAATRERSLKRVKEYSDKNKAKILAYQADYYKTNTERVKSNVRAYRKSNPDKKTHLENRRRASKFMNGGSHTLPDRLAKFQRLGNICFYCRQPKKLSIDHDIPLSRGGTDDIDNILPACRSCNSKKHDRTAIEFLAKINRYHLKSIGDVQQKENPSSAGTR